MKNTNAALANSLTRRGFVAAAGAVLAMAGGAFALNKLGMDVTPAIAEEAAETHTVTDMAGNELELPVEITTYADGWYAHNEITIMLTQAKGLVATHCTPEGNPWMYYVNPNMKNALSTFGTDFNYEELVELNPQVVFDSKEDMREKLDSLGIPLVNCSFSTYDEMKQSITLSGDVFGGDAVEIAAKYNAELDSVLEEVTAITGQVADEDKPTVLHGNSVYTFKLDGTGTIIDAWIEAAGGKNANTAGTKDAQTEFSLEQIIEWNPDVIITGTASEVDEILNDESWASITAVQNGAVYANPKGVFSWDRYGVEELLQIQWAAATLHPELFPDFTIEQKVKDFYQTYLNYELTDEEVALILAGQNPPAEDGEADSAAGDK